MTKETLKNTLGMTSDMPAKKTETTEKTTMPDVMPTGDLLPKEPKSLAEAILFARQNFDHVLKTNVNTFHKSKYADLNSYLDAVLPALTAWGVLLTQPIIVRDGQCLVGTKLERGSESLEAFLPLPPLQDPQKIGSCVTYFRRYTLASLLALGAEDDDAEAATRAKTNRAQQQALTIDAAYMHKIEGNVKSKGTVVGTLSIDDLQFALGNERVVAALTERDRQAMKLCLECKLDDETGTVVDDD